MTDNIDKRLFPFLNRALSNYNEAYPGSSGGYLSLVLSSDQWALFKFEEKPNDLDAVVLWSGQTLRVRKDPSLPEQSVIVEVIVSHNDVRDWMRREKNVRFLNARPIIATNQG